MDCVTNKTYTVQISFMSEMENELLYMVKESCGITIEKKRIMLPLIKGM